ncbi:MAG TPA: hypothetical protein VG712_00425 [Gemmatimonadales bacterium]|nr:hypothetical protein [Gemmatimonadales bacterium]
MRPTVALLIAAALATATPLSAQAPDRDRPALLADETFSEGGFDPVRVFLARGTVYRVEFSEPAVILSMRSWESKPLPFVVTVNLGPDATGRTNYELRPQVDGVIEFKPEYVQSGKAVRFRIWSLGDGSHGVHAAAAHRPVRWEFGVMVERAHHGAYVNSIIRYAEAGGSSSICAAIRNGPGILERLWGCIVGLDWETGGAEFRTKWMYTDPRIRVVQQQLANGVRVEAGISMRYGQRLAEPTKADTVERIGTSMYSVGGYAGLQLRERTIGTWTILATMNAQHVSGRNDKANGAGTTAFRLTLGKFF